MKLLHCEKKSKSSWAGEIVSLAYRRTVYLSRISHGSGLPAFMRRGTKVSGTNESPLCWRETRKRKMGDGKRGWGKRKTEEKIKKKKREENRRDRILLFGRGHAWFEVSPSRGAFEHSWKGEEGGDGGEEGEKEEENKKKNIFLRLCTLFTQIYDRWLRHR